MSLLGSTCSFTRFRITEDVPASLWQDIPSKLKQFAFMDIDELPEERAWGWTAFDDMLDTKFVTPQDKGEFLAFALRLDTRRVPPAVIKKHVLLALREEEARNREQGKKFVSRERRNELRDQVKLRLMTRFLPIPALFEVAWATDINMVYLASTQSKIIDLFMNHFTLTFDLHLEAYTPYTLATQLLNKDLHIKLDTLESTRFV